MTDVTPEEEEETVEEEDIDPPGTGRAGEANALRTKTGLDRVNAPGAGDAGEVEKR